MNLARRLSAIASSFVLGAVVFAATARLSFLVLGMPLESFIVLPLVSLVAGACVAVFVNESMGAP